MPRHGSALRCYLSRWRNIPGSSKRGQGVPEAIRFNIQDAFCMVDLAENDSDFDSIFDLKSDEHIEAFTGKAQVTPTWWQAKQVVRAIQIPS